MLHRNRDDQRPGVGRGANGTQPSIENGGPRSHRDQVNFDRTNDSVG